MSAEQFMAILSLIIGVFCLLMALAIVTDMVRGWLERRREMERRKR